jgi:hypothetical protein
MHQVLSDERTPRLLAGLKGLGFREAMETLKLRSRRRKQSGATARLHETGARCFPRQDCFTSNNETGSRSAQGKLRQTIVNCLRLIQQAAI